MVLFFNVQIMKNERKFAFLCLYIGFTFISCSKSNDSVSNVGLLWSEVQPAASAVRPLMVDKNATTEATALFYNLKSYSTQGIMLGQQDAFTDRYTEQSNVYYETPDIKLTTGKNPIIVGADFIFTTNYHNDGTTASGWWYEQELLLRKVMLAICTRFPLYRNKCSRVFWVNTDKKESV
jgi:mannan endo-1,4-beta-mannosidase